MGGLFQASQLESFPARFRREGSSWACSVWMFVAAGPRAQHKTNKEGQQTTTDYKKNCKRAENGDSTKKPTDVRNETNYGSIDLWKTCRIGQFKTKFNPAKEIGLRLSEALEHRHQPQYVRPEIEKQKPDCMS